MLEYGVFLMLALLPDHLFESLVIPLCVSHARTLLPGVFVQSSRVCSLVLEDVAVCSLSEGLFVFDGTLISVLDLNPCNSLAYCATPELLRACPHCLSVLS